MSPRDRYLGSWTLPTGNTADVYLFAGRLECRWNRPPSPAWPRADVEHWRVVATVTGQDVLGVSA